VLKDALDMYLEQFSPTNQFIRTYYTGFKSKGYVVDEGNVMLVDDCF